MSQKIRKTLGGYHQPPSRLFEVLFGEPIPEEIATARQVVIAREPELFLIMAEFHDSPPPFSWEDYGDMLIYQSLNQHLRGNREKARKYFDQAYSMWDGKGILDAEAREKNRYAGQNLALILYVSRVLDMPINQQIEATAMALLVYNEDLIARMR